MSREIEELNRRFSAIIAEHEAQEALKEPERRKRELLRIFDITVEEEEQPHYAEDESIVPSSQARQSWTSEGVSFEGKKAQAQAATKPAKLSDIFLSDQPVWVHCHETGLPLFQLDDNTVAMYRELDPSGKLLSQICLQGYTHPALKAFRGDMTLLAETCPQIFLCFLLHKFIVYPHLERVTWDWMQAMEDTDSVICQLYDNEDLTDDDIADLLETCVLVRCAGNKTADTLPLADPLDINAERIREFVQSVSKRVSTLPRKPIYETINGMEQADWKFALTVQHLRPLPQVKGDRWDNPMSVTRKVSKAVVRKTSVPTKITMLDVLDTETLISPKASVNHSANISVAPSSSSQASPMEKLAALRAMMACSKQATVQETVQGIGKQDSIAEASATEPSASEANTVQSSAIQPSQAQPSDLLSKLAALRALRGK